MSEFEKQVRHALIDKGWSMSDLATELGLSVSYLHDIVTGKRKAVHQKVRIRQMLCIPDNSDCDEEEQNVSD